MKSPLNLPSKAANQVQLDPQALGRLRDLDPDGRKGVLTRVLTAFEASLARTLPQLQAELDTNNAAVVSTIAHTLKSSSASVGAAQLAQACGDVEGRLRRGDSSELRRDIVRLMSEAEAALVAVATILRP